MYSLILDTTYKKLLVALANENVVIDKIEYDAWQQQSEYTIQEIENILKNNNISPKDINEILATNGPGSYTGVRIALTIAKIYCLALNIPCYVFSSLEVLQEENKTSICLINARSNRSYIGVYSNKDIILSDQVMKNEDVIKYIEKHRDFAICGELSYLGLNDNYQDLAKNMIRLKDDKYKISDILKLKAVYLKD